MAIPNSDLQLANGQFRQLADALPSMVWICREDGQTEYFNRTWYDRTGQSHATGNANDEQWIQLSLSNAI